MFIFIRLLEMSDLRISFHYEIRSLRKIRTKGIYIYIPLLNLEELLYELSWLIKCLLGSRAAASTIALRFPQIGHYPQALGGTMLGSVFPDIF